jgi:hypothetical protein
VGPLGNQPLMIRFIGGFFFSAKFGPGFVILVGKQGLMEVKGWNSWNLIKITYLCLSKLVSLRILKYSVVILLFSSLIAHTFSRSLVLADYLVNMESYKKTCVNKAKPMMHCNGKCQMLKKIKKQEGESNTNAPAPKFNQQELILSSKSFYPTIEMFRTQENKFFYAFNSSFNSNYISSIFHPPGV